MAEKNLLSILGQYITLQYLHAYKQYSCAKITENKNINIIALRSWEKIKIHNFLEVFECGQNI